MIGLYERESNAKGIENPSFHFVWYSKEFPNDHKVTLSILLSSSMNASGQWHMKLGWRPHGSGKTFGWIYKNVFGFTDAEISKMQDYIEDEEDVDAFLYPL